MLSLFKKVKNTPRFTEKSIGEVLAKELELKLLFVQEKWAQWMARKTAKLSRRRLLVLWAFFVIVSVGYSIFLIANGFLGSSSSSLTITPIVTLEKQGQTTNSIRIRDNARGKKN